MPYLTTKYSFCQNTGLIDVVGKDGGYIMARRAPMDHTDPELVKIWIDYTKEYGVYRTIK